MVSYKMEELVCVSGHTKKDTEPFLLIKRSIDCLVLFQPK